MQQQQQQQKKTWLVTYVPLEVQNFPPDELADFSIPNWKLSNEFGFNYLKNKIGKIKKSLKLKLFLKLCKK